MHLLKLKLYLSNFRSALQTKKAAQSERLFKNYNSIKCVKNKIFALFPDFFRNLTDKRDFCPLLFHGELVSNLA